jgi:hypothetical protein
MKRYRFLSLLLVSVSLLTISCEKEGPAGPAGPAGSAGATGPAGSTGPAGPAGTANVIYSAWTPFVAGDWADSTMSNLGTAKRANRVAPGLSQSVLDNGIVLAFTRFPGGVGVGPYMLPFVILSSQPPIVLAHLPALGRVIFYNQRTDNTGGIIVNTNYEFRYILIPGGVSGGRLMSGNGAGYTVDQLKAMPYDQVLKKFNIPSEGSNQ